MRIIAASLLLIGATYAQTPSVGWQLASITGADPRGAIGWFRPVIDPMSGQVMINSSYQNQSGVLHTTAMSNLMTYVSGDPISIGWGQAAGDSITVCGNVYTLATASVVAGVSVTTTTNAPTTGNCAYSVSSGSIYAGDFFYLNTATSTMTWGNGVRCLVQCAWADLTSYPGPRHPGQQQAVDTKRGRIWFTGGADGTNSPQSSTHLNYITSNANPTSNTFGRLVTAHTPFGSPTSGSNGPSALAYDPDDDILLGYGGTGYDHMIWAAAITDLNPNPGTLTAKQASAGAVLADDWTDVQATYPTTGTGGVACTVLVGAGVPSACPVGGQYAGWVYNNKTHLFYLFGGLALAGGTSPNTTWSYNPRTRVWTQLALTGTVPPAATGPAPQASLFVLPNGIMLYIYGGNTTATTYALDPSTNTWSIWTNSGGTGPNNSLASSGWTEGTYDPVNNKIVAVSLGQTGAGAGGNGIELWYGTITGTPASSLVVPLTVQPALYGGAPADVARTAEPFCMGVPIADAAAITSTSGLTLTGATNGAQFRILGSWPSGNAKWIKTCGIASTVAANGTATVNLQNGGAGNWGSIASLATDNVNCSGGSDTNRISIDTGVACFEVKKANTNILDVVKIGATTVVASSASATRGLVLTGPDPTAGTVTGKVTCSPDTGGSTCATLYTSANDSASTAVIEENGPVLAVIKVNGTHYDGAGHPYMHFTVRIPFYKDKTTAKAVIILRNADYAASTSGTPSADCNASGGSCTGHTFNTAFKAIKSYELRLAPNVSAPITYNIATDTTPVTGTVSTAAYVYQGQTDYVNESVLSQESGTAYDPNKLTADIGFVIKNNTTSLATGDQTKHVGGWADCSNSSGVGVQLGVYQFSGFWPISLECFASPEVRIGLYSSHNLYTSSWAAVYMPWPQWQIWDIMLNFHVVVPTDPQGDFQRMQDVLLARPARTYVNTTSVFPYTLVDPAEEDAYYVNLATSSLPLIPLGSTCYGGGTTNCTPDRFLTTVSNGQPALTYLVWRTTTWGNGGGPSYQQENRWSDILKFFQRGYTGRWLAGWNHYRMQTWGSWPHLDGGNINGTDATINSALWSEKLRYIVSNNETGASGRPQMHTASTIINYDNSYIDYPDFEHNHWWGSTDAYMMSGDETTKEGMYAEKAYYLNPDTYQATCCGGTDQASRTWGAELGSAAHYYEYLSSIGDSDANTVLSIANNAWINVVDTVPCMADGAGNHYPNGCTLPNLTSSGGFTKGISLERGIHLGWRTDSVCPAQVVSPSNARYAQNFMMSILIEGMAQYARVKGSSWSDYWRMMDKGMGVGQWMLSEGYLDNGTNQWCTQPTTTGCLFSGDHYNGLRYRVFADFANNCPSGAVADGAQKCQVGSDVWACNFTVAGNATVWWPFLQYFNETGNRISDWERQFKAILIRANVASPGTKWAYDYGGVQVGQLIHDINHPGTTSLQDITITGFSNLGGGDQSITFTVPAGSSNPRLKIDPGTGSYSPRTIQTDLTRLLDFEPLNTNTFGTNATTNLPWFSATDYTSQLPAWTVGSHTATIHTGTTTLASGNFSLKAFNLNGCGLSPTSLGPWTNTQSTGFATLTAPGCTASIFACTGLPTGLSINSSTGSITGTITASGTFTPTCTYAAASQPYTILVNVAPIITTSGALASITTGGNYTALSQSLTTSGGTGTKTCVLFSGSLTGSGITLNTDCTLSGTAATPGTYNFTAKATDDNFVTGAASSGISITVNAAAGGNGGTIRGGKQRSNTRH